MTDPNYTQGYKNYLAQIHEQRVKEHAQEVAKALQTARDEVNDAIRYRDEGARERVSYQEFRERDRMVMDAEANYRDAVSAAQVLQPQKKWFEDPRIVKWAQEHSEFFNRHGIQQANAAVEGCLSYMTRPRNERAPNNPHYTGMGKTWDQCMTGEGLKEMETLLEMHGPAYYGVQFHSEQDKSLTTNEACRISFGRLNADTAKKYNEGHRAIEQERARKQRD
jgi:hypothetical protein